LEITQSLDKMAFSDKLLGLPITHKILLDIQREIMHA
jgi:hypothetical protein